LSVRTQRERHEQFERERAVVQARDAVVSAVAPAYVGRVGSSAVHEAVDEALAQIVAAGDHLGEPEQVKALWITCARRRLIDELRSAEAKHRDATPVDETATGLGAQLRGDDLSRLTDDARQEWRIRELLSVLRGDQRLWAEAWYDEVLSGSRPSGAQPRGLGDALGWTPSKTKSVSQRARKRMATFIDNRAKGVICDEQRVLLDAYVRSGRRRHGHELDDDRYEAALIHVAGCEDCFAAWHTRRRSMPVRCGAILTLPIDGVADALHGLSAKATCLAMGAYGQAASLVGRLGIGGAAAGGGIASLGGKATAVCVGVVCAATAGGEIAGVLPAIPIEPAHQTSEEAARPKPAEPAADPSDSVIPQQAVVTPPPPPPATTTAAPPPPPPADPEPVVDKAAETPVAETPGDLPTADPVESTPAAAGNSSPSRGSSQASGGSSSQSRGSTPSTAAKKPNCVPGDLGC
jgi:DNA-directed RNA polymerase specialized sigma24 family protein